MPDYTTEQLSFLRSSGKVVLHACPGSGKTTVVAKKMIDYLQHWDRSHQGIAVLSFTNVASDEINRQAAEILSDGFSVDAPHFVGTLDSFIDNFIFLQFGYLLLESPQRPIITSTDIAKSYSYWRAECYQKCVPYISVFRWDSYGCLTKNGSNITCTGTGRYDPPCIQFKKRMLKKGQFFQDEIAGLSCILLERYPEVAKSIASRFPVIILDEAQDTSKEQMRIIDLLCAAGLESVYIIGDPDQSIYEWRNANPESFLEKMHDPDWTQLSLSKNFRSSQLICNATYVFSDIYKDKTANDAAGACATFNKKPTLILYGKNAAEETITQKFFEECTSCNITLSPITVAIVTRGRIHADDCVENLWKTPETELLARASFEWMSGNRRKAYSCCEKALFQMTIKDSKDVDKPIEYEISNIMPYDQWKQLVIEILINLPSANEQCGQWVTNCRTIIDEVLTSHQMTILGNISVNDMIKIKSRDTHNSDFKNIPIKNYFEIKSQNNYTHSSVHGVKGESFDALLLYIQGTRGGNTLTPSFLANGNTNTELMRIAYVAMTRPRKLLAIAMPKSTANLSVRFPKETWDYVVI